MRAIFTEEHYRLFYPHQPLTEEEYERQLLRSLSTLFPDFHSSSWKPIIRDGFGRAARPDLIMISKDLESWYVVEVELASHDVHRHVIPQLETLNMGIYDSTLVPSIQQAWPVKPPGVLENLVYRPPGQLCIADTYTERLHEACRDNDFDLAVLEPYRDIDGRAALSVNKAPTHLTNSQSVGVYQLARQAILGDKVVFILPQHFPPWRGKVDLIDLAGRTRSCRIHVTGSKRTILIDSDMISSSKSTRLKTVDSRDRILRLEIE